MDTPPPAASPPLPSPPPPPAPGADNTFSVHHVEAKASLLLLALLLMVLGAVGYLAYARGAFESTQTLVLVSDDSEGVGVGMDLTFAGFPIGRVKRIELAPDGNARIVIDVPLKDAHWLRESSIFTLVRGVVGNTNIRAYSGVLTDPPLPD
ncbi:MAG TPA: MlaD family protein, partial [Burkholderiaceae bacterium]|nr:MlaD family protein [Burkholderiaceae bacterium]